MGRTRTILVDLARLRVDEDSASIIIRLMMACNDIALANQCLGKFKEEQKPIRKPVQRGALMYFVRLQCGHLYEGLKIIQEIKDNRKLSEGIGRCSQAGRDAFDILANCLEDGSERQKFQDYVERIRHKTIFHYDKKLVAQALRNRAGREEARRSKITWGDNINLFRFEVSDDIVNTIVCRQIFKISSNEDLQKEVDEIMVWGADISKSLIEFGGEFISRYIMEHAAI